MDGMAKRAKKIGRPLKWKSPEKLQELIDEYFAVTPLEEQMITGLAVHLGTDRSTLCNYEERDEFSNTIKRAKSLIEMAYEKRGLDKGTAFDIFRLKNMGWKDKQEVESRQDISVTGLPAAIAEMIGVNE